MNDDCDDRCHRLHHYSSYCHSCDADFGADGDDAAAVVAGNAAVRIHRDDDRDLHHRLRDGVG